MMKIYKAFSAICLLFLATCVTGQNSVDPYAGHAGVPFELNGVYPSNIDASYDGEYQIHLTDFFWEADVYDLKYKIETVSFPFVTRDIQHTTAGVRDMIMPDLDSYGFNDETGPCRGWAWDENDYLSSPDKRDLLRVASGAFTTTSAGPSNYYMSGYATLISKQFHAEGQVDLCGDLGYRQWLPHTILKHTIYAYLNDAVFDSISWVYDHTRGRMRNYPFTGHGIGGMESWDVIFRPALLTDGANHSYGSTDNGSWYEQNSVPFETANYFPRPYNYNDLEVIDILYPDDPANTNFVPGGFNNFILHPPPYSLLEAPILNSVGDAYAGYAPDALLDQQILFNTGGNPDWDAPHTYIIDKPIDLRLINPSEKIIYNPSEVIVEMAGQHVGAPLRFPTGYTFRTVHSTYPGKAMVDAVDPEGYYPNPALAPVPSNLGATSSVYRIMADNHVLIEPCVTIMDAEFIVESGGSLTYDQGSVDGNFIITNNGGSVIPLSASPPSLPCPINCYQPGFMEVKDLEVSGVQSWSVSSLPNDANNDGVLRVAGRITLTDGARLTIEPGVRFEFGPHGRIILERGAYLDADEVTFTAACNSMWHGIEVWGTRDRAQYPTSNNPDQGVLIAHNCTFEHAREAIRVFRSDDPTAGTDWDYNGGVFKGSYNTFRNNYRGVHIRPTANIYNSVEVSNACRILQSSFICDDYLLDAAYNDGFGERRASVEQIRLHGVKGVIISYCSFSTSLPGATNFPPHLRGTGVFTLDASQSISACGFNGLSEGVWHALGSHFVANTRIRNNEFVDCIHSVVTVASALDEITGNTIFVPVSPQYGYSVDDLDQGYDYPVGIYCQGSYDYHIEGNTIIGSEPDGTANLWSYGIISNQSNAEDDWATSIMHMNTIQDVNVGIQCEGDNKGQIGASGLMIECTDFQQGIEVWNHDITVVSNWIDGSMSMDGFLRDQGACTSPNTQPANLFSALDANTTTLDHFYFDNNTINQNLFFSYRGDALPNPQATNVPNLQSCNLTARACEPIIDCGRPCLIDREGEMSDLINMIQGELDEATSTTVIAQLEGDLNYYEARLHTIWNALARHAIEHEDLDGLLKVWNKYNGIDKHRKLVAVFVANGMLVEANSLIDLIVDEEGGTPSDHTALLQLKVSIGGAIEALTEPQKQQLERIISENPLGAPAAKAMLRQVDGSPYDRVPWTLGDTPPGLRNTDQERMNVSSLQVWPNPVTDQLNVVATDEILLINVLSIDGREVEFPKSLSGNMALCDLGTVANGCYVLQVSTVMGEVFSRTIVISGKK